MSGGHLQRTEFNKRLQNVMKQGQPGGRRDFAGPTTYHEEPKPLQKQPIQAAQPVQQSAPVQERQQLFPSQVLELNYMSAQARDNLAQLNALINYDEEELEHDQQLQAMVEEDIDRQTEQSDYSRLLLSLNECVYIPRNCNRFVRSCNVIQSCGALQGNHALPEWKPSANAVDVAFGSQTDYAQGLNVEKVDRKIGNMNNTYMLYLGIREIRNDFPFPVGVTFGEKLQNDWKPLEHRGKVYNGREYHAILPAYSHHLMPDKDVVCFKSTSEINHYYSEKFPSHFADNLHEGISQTGRNMALLPLDSPVTEYIYRNMDRFNWPTPTPGQEESTMGYVVADRIVAQKALELTREVFNKFLKITNLSAFACRFDRLDSGVLAGSDKAVEMAKPGSMDRQYGVSFELNSIHVFKDRFDDIMESEEQLEAQQGWGRPPAKGNSYPLYKE